MNVTVLHTKDALEPPVDPVLDQLEHALRDNGHETRRVVVDDTVEPLVTSLNRDRPDLVFNLAESFGGKSALESNVAALLNLLKLRYTGSSPAGLIMAGDKTLTKKSCRSIASSRRASLRFFAGMSIGQVTLISRSFSNRRKKTRRSGSRRSRSSTTSKSCSKRSAHCRQNISRRC